MNNSVINDGATLCSETMVTLVAQNADASMTMSRSLDSTLLINYCGAVTKILDKELRYNTVCSV